ncbi:MAG: sensor histidine kinase, partial [bacterium]
TDMTALVRNSLRSVKQHDAMNVADLEQEVEGWLKKRKIENPWEYTSGLVSIGLDAQKLDQLAAEIAEERHLILFVIIKSSALLYEIYSLLNQVVMGSGRISEIVVALKNYAFLDRDSLEDINVHEGIDDTLIIMKSRLKKGIRVHKNYALHLKKITAVGRELNQVWTNIIDNAVDSMEGEGDITITTKNDNDHIVVQIENNGPEIPKQIQSKIFDPFFTTKEPGKGIGLGLSTSYSIVTEKQKGSITVKSDKNFTCFEIRLPVNLQTTSRTGQNGNF